MDILKHIKYIKVKCELLGVTTIREESPSHVILGIDIRLVMKEDEKGTGVDLNLIRMEELHEIGDRFYKMGDIIASSKYRAHQIFQGKYAENKDLWVNFVRKAHYIPTYSFEILKHVWEDDNLEFAQKEINFDFDRMLFQLENDAKQIAKYPTDK